jgi:hypothetical protein
VAIETGRGDTQMQRLSPRGAGISTEANRGKTVLPAVAQTTTSKL